MLPNEFQLAEEFGVSQGTVRKALNSLTDAKVLTRRQGVGTFVSEHTAQHGLYRFFPLVADGKNPELPKAQQVSLKLEDADENGTSRPWSEQQGAGCCTQEATPAGRGKVYC